jgi:hypothetical protein
MARQMNMLKETKFGDFIISKSDPRQATLHCVMPSSGTLTLDLLDNLGRSYLHTSLAVKPGAQTLTFSIPSLSAGDYNAWISFGDKTAIKHITIKKPKSGKFSFKFFS